MRLQTENLLSDHVVKKANTQYKLSGWKQMKVDALQEKCRETISRVARTDRKCNANLQK